MKHSVSRSLPRLVFSHHARAVGPATIEPFLGSRQLQRMFDRIGSSYDMQNHLLSFGLDALWRRFFVDVVQPSEGATLYDMAIGTGDISIPMARRYPTIRVVGVDYSSSMLIRARRKIRTAGLEERISLLESDIRECPLPDSTADLITSAFTLRNLPDRDRVLSEFHRLLKPGGRLCILELGLPQGGAARMLYEPYFDHVMPFVGNLLSRTDYAYSYLRESVRAFPRPEEFLSELRRAGFAKSRAVYISFGTAVLYLARRVA